jgi:RNA polymerase sigma-70 factor, ECF subfamily
MPQTDEFKAAFDEFSHSIRRYIAFRISDTAAVDDILQEVFISLYKNGDKIKSKEKLKSWLYTVAKNAIIDHARAKKLVEALPDDIADISNDDGFHKELSGCIKHFAHTLPPAYSEVTALYEFEELSADEIAKKLSIPLATVKSKIQRGRKKLKEALFGCCEFEFDRHGTPIDFRPKCCKTPRCLKK